MIRRCDKHYSLALIGLQSYEDSESMVKWHVLGVCVKEDYDWFCVFDWTMEKTWKLSNGKKLKPPRRELGTLCVLDRCENHYTISTMGLHRF